MLRNENARIQTRAPTGKILVSVPFNIKIRKKCDSILYELKK